MNSKLSKRSQQLLPHINRKAVIEFAIRTLCNCHDLRMAANTLFESKQYGPARSLAISSREEFGKFIISLRYLTGQIKAEEFLFLRDRHIPKQMWGVFLTSLISILSSALTNMEIIFNRKLKSFSQLGGDLIKKLDENVDVIESIITEHLPVLERKVRDARAHRDEFRRQDGLYVSIDLESGRASIRYPRMVTQAEAKAELDILDSFLETVNTFENLFDVAELDEIDSNPLQLEQLIEIFDQIFNPELINESAKG